MTTFIKQLFTQAEKPEPLKAGIYHWQSPADAENQYRLHLRIEPDHTGILIINAATVLHLNTSAAAHAYHIVQGDSVDEAAESISKDYFVSKKTALRDQEQIRAQIETLATNPEVDPVLFMDIDRREPYSQKPSAPYRLDLALTYRLDDSGRLDPLARQRVDRELSQDEWVSIMTKAWDAGVPHLIFTGGEPTLRPDLVDLIIEAEKLGQVTGLLTNGLRLSDSEYVSQLEQAGLDHLLITLDPDNQGALDGLRNALDSDIFTAVHLTLTPAEFDALEGTLDRLAKLGVTQLSLSSSDKSESTQKALSQAVDLAAIKGFKLVWDIPVPYSQTNPISAELDEAPDGAGVAWLYVEPDGDVLPAQGIEHVLGNLARDSFQSIWQA
ncbi:MAG: radical SAM protein [Anaerolineales bacterium]|jgi:organic radical activating enzyme